MRLLLDEMIGPRVAGELREQGLDAVGVVESTDLRALSDAAVLEHALLERRVVVTRNVSDFARLDARWRSEGRLHSGIVMISEQAFPQNRNLVGALVMALRVASEAAARPGAGDVLYLRPAAKTRH